MFRGLTSKSGNHPGLMNSNHPSNKTQTMSSRFKTLLHRPQNILTDIEHGPNSLIVDNRSNFQTLRAAKPIEMPDSLDADPKEVFKIVTQHKRFSAESLGDGFVENLPAFDDSTAYDINPETQDKLWYEEVKRLVGVVNNLQSAPVFTGTPRLANDSKEAYESLALLAGMVWSGMSICIHDNEAIFLEHLPLLHDKEDFETSKFALELLTETSSNDEQNNQIATLITREELFLFIDYLTAATARVFCTAMYGKEYHNQVLAILAVWSTKLKIVSTNLEGSAEASLQAAFSITKASPSQNSDAEGVQVRSPSEDKTERTGSSEEWDGFIPGSQASGTSKDLDMGPETPENFLRRAYFIQRYRSRNGVWKVFRSLLLSLRGHNRLMTTSRTVFEVCSMTYENGFNNFPTLIFQDRTECFIASSDSNVVDTGHAAFDLLNISVCQVDERIRKERKQTSSTSNSSINIQRPGSSVPTNLSWNHSNSNPDAKLGVESEERRVYLESMNDIISILVPLQLSSPKVAKALYAYVRAVMFTASKTQRLDDMVPYQRNKLKAFFSLSTDEYQMLAGERKDLGVSSLSKALMTREKLLASKQVGLLSHKLTTTDLKRTREELQQIRQEERTQIKKRQKEIEIANDRMSEWVFEENGVRVKCGLYVWTIVFICLVLVVSGIIIGLTVHTRVPGVDPFNITTYLWVMAGFIIYAAQSVRVENWVWRDFLLRRVLCRSISELHSVTRIDEQLILAKLLHDEDTSILKTRGPYNCPFLRKSEDGFSIDKPLSMWTMLLSGLIMVQVQTPRGPALVCLDVRKGTSGVIEEENMPTEEEKYIYCDTLESHDKKRGTERRLRLKYGQLGWHRVDGLYSGHDSVFV
jgi:hypothetical protein